jgi:hypothetical protein
LEGSTSKLDARRWSPYLVAALLLGAPMALSRFAKGDAVRDAPEFPTLEPSRWVGEPVAMRSLRGKVVLLDVWTFG